MSDNKDYGAYANAMKFLKNRLLILDQVVEPEARAALVREIEAVAAMARAAK